MTAERCHRQGLSYKTKMLILALIWVFVSILATLPSNARAEELPNQARFGVATNRNPWDYPNSQGLEMSWYHNWGARPWLNNGVWQAIPGVQFYPTVGAWGELWGKETKSNLESYIAACPECYPAGTIWIIGNELEYDTFDKINGTPITPRTITPDEYAQKYKKYYDIIKAIDPTYRVAVGATYGSFLTSTMEAYRQRYGVKMPIDVYTLHAYMDTSNPDILNQVKGQVNHKRKIMKDNGDRAKWLIITETGALWDAGAETITRYMNDVFDYLSTATSSDLGCIIDGNRLVQRWAWFALTSWDSQNDHRWDGTDLLDIDTKAITPVGQAYADYPKAPPTLPSAFWGTVKYNGSNVANGTVVQAWISDTLIVSATTTTYDGSSVYSLDIPADDPLTGTKEGGVDGEAVRFKFGANWADQRGTWQTGGVVNLNLSKTAYCEPPKSWIANFGVVGGGWTSQTLYPRTVADVTGDGKADIVGFGSRYTYVSRSTGSSFAIPSGWTRNFGMDAGGWTDNNLYPRTLADTNGDGKADIVGFGSKGVYVSLSSSTAFYTPTKWIANFGVLAGGWTSQDAFPRMPADMNGDNKADIVAFGSSGVYVSLSNGKAFGTPSRWLDSFGSGQGWSSQNTYPRAVGDINGDGKADVVGFGSNGVYVSLSTGTRLGAPSLWLADFAVSAGGWTDQNTQPRFLADINGDGKADIVGMKTTGTYVAFSTGTGFRLPVLWISNFGQDAGGWTSQEKFPRVVADVTGDGRADIIGFGNKATYVAVTNPGQFTSVAGQAAEEVVDAVTIVSIEDPNTTVTELQATPVAALDAAISTWQGEYFANTALEGEPVLVRDDAKVWFDWGREAPDPSLPVDEFSARWTQTRYFNEGLYTFSAVADDGVRLFVDDQLIIDRWGDEQPIEASEQVSLAAGEHLVRLEYYESGEDAYVRLWWEQSSAPRAEREAGTRGNPER